VPIDQCWCFVRSLIWQSDHDLCILWIALKLSSNHGFGWLMSVALYFIIESVLTFYSFLCFREGAHGSRSILWLCEIDCGSTPVSIKLWVVLPCSTSMPTFCSRSKPACQSCSFDTGVWHQGIRRYYGIKGYKGPNCTSSWRCLLSWWCRGLVE